jgi:hypothetical protein
MKTHARTLLAAFVILHSSFVIPLAAQVPNLLNYQGRVAVGTTNFNGTGTFRFALVNANGSTVYWRNSADTAPADGVPDTGVSLTVTRGLYSVLLGDTSLPGMALIPATVWANADVRLRVWFNDGTSGNQLLTPDQRLAPNGYLPAGVVTAAQIADGSITSAKLAAGAQAAPATVSTSTHVTVANTNYAATGAGATVFNLPVSANLGDRIHISGVGAGGWSANSLFDVWTPRENTRRWTAIASSSDGTKLVAAVDGGYTYTSTDSGATWAEGSQWNYWNYLTSSADGVRLVALAGYSGVWTSSNSGATWTNRTPASRYWRSVASSASGQYLVAATYDGPLYVSTNYGDTWEERGPVQSWTCVASSTDGQRLVAGSFWSGQVYVSTDGGSTWIPQGILGNWASVASSADGTKLVAAREGGQLYTWQTGGSWTPRGPVSQWLHLASSSDGSRLIAVPDDGNLFTSSDSGATWTLRAPSLFRKWRMVASSADGLKLAGAAQDDLLYTSGGALLSGSQGTDATLQYLGDGQWGAVADLVGPWNLSGANVYRTPGNVGIGTATPSTKLTIQTPFNTSGLLHTDGTILLNTFVGGSPLAGSIGTSSNHPLHLFANGTSPRLTIDTAGNVGIGKTNPGTKLDVVGDVTCVAVNLTSDRNAKEHFTPVDARAVLEKVAQLPISEWQYKEHGDARHVGPMAQDFHAAFSLGRDDRHITSVDADGVALAAIQGLNEKLEEQVKARDTELDRLRTENRSLAERLAAIERALGLRHESSPSMK